MKVPRNISGNDLISYLVSIGFQKVRQTGSHVRLELVVHGELFGITVPLHDPLKVGTLSNIIKDVAQKTGRDWMKILKEL
jgi:predicted RNA binding protein YcfA (HicA-like mRNA interferase family)